MVKRKEHRISRVSRLEPKAQMREQPRRAGGARIGSQHVGERCENEGDECELREDVPGPGQIPVKGASIRRSAFDVRCSMFAFLRTGRRTPNVETRTPNVEREERIRPLTPALSPVDRGEGVRRSPRS